MTKPRAFWTHAGAARWAAARNPYKPGSDSYREWHRDFWDDQADRVQRRAFVFGCVSLASFTFAIVWHFIGAAL